jgi:hypothetical protein
LAVPSNPGGNTVRIANGAALVNGYVWWSDANEDFDVSGGNANATDLIVLRSTPATGLVRLALVRGAVASTATVTQTAATWEIAIAEVLLDGSGNFSALTDVREPCLPKGAVIPLEQKVITSAVAGFSMSSIPSLFSHLLIEAYARSDDPAPLDSATIGFNSDVGANYVYSEVRGQNGAVTHLSGNGRFAFDSVTAATGVANYFDGCTIRIQNYSNTTNYKVANIVGGAAGSAVTSASGLLSFSGSVWWANTAAINSVEFAMVNGNFDVGCVFSLYGIV